MQRMTVTPSAYLEDPPMYSAQVCKTRHLKDPARVEPDPFVIPLIQNETIKLWEDKCRI